MTSRLDQRGTALVAVLGIAMILLPLGAFVALQAQTDIVIERNLRRELEAFYVAEAGLEHAIAEIGAGQGFDELFAGPDRIAGTGDDGVFPFRTQPPAFFPHPPWQYAVEVMPVRSDLVRVVSRGSGESGSASVLEALVTRATSPFTPAPLFIEADPRGLTIGDEFAVSGWDHRLVGGVPQRMGAVPPVPALVSTSDDAVRLLRERLATLGDRLEGAGGTPSVAAASRLGIDGYAARLAQHPAAVHVVPTGTGPLSLGTTEVPQLTVIDGNLDVGGTVSGAGALVIRGSLRVTGTFDFAGLLLVADGIVGETGSTVNATGALWQAAGVDARVELRGRGALRYSSTALAAVDRFLPGTLPHAATVVGWQEHL